MTELEERIEQERERTAVMQRQLECECPDSCTIDHDN